MIILQVIECSGNNEQVVEVLFEDDEYYEISELMKTLKNRMDFPEFHISFYTEED